MKQRRKFIKRLAIITVMVVIAVCGVTCYKNAENIIENKNSIITELENINKNINEELETLKNNLRNVEEEKEAIKQELDNKNKKLEGFEAVFSSSVISITLEELDLFFRLVEAEAGNEAMVGKIAVANVVINRVRDKRFPNTVKEVIYQPYQFEPIVNGHINKKPSADSKEAVLRALLGEQVVDIDTISFWANYLDSSNELWKLPITSKIGVHVFTNKM